MSLNPKLFSVWLFIGWALVAAVVYLPLSSSLPDVLDFSSGDKVKHFVAYGALMGRFFQIYSAGKVQMFWAVAFFPLGVLLGFVQG